jgi:hypothetical protein
MRKELELLSQCFKEDFTGWLLKSNNKRIPNTMNGCSEIPLSEIVEESLNEIFSILLDCPKADYFWYSYREHGSKLSYSLPNHQVVPGDALRVDKSKISAFFRDRKLESIGI